MEKGALLYHEPDSQTVATYASFILLLNVVDYCLDRAVYCGLVGQILLGIAWGTPGAQLLPEATEVILTDLGYLGLILLVFEGGLSTNFKSFSSNLFLSALVALTGISTPIGLSFVLIKLCDASTLQAFAAGCALSSTSLGTTFAVLKSSGMVTSRLGTVLTSAALFDDVVGLVLVQIIANVGTSQGGSLSASIIVRPVFVSIAFAVAVPAICWVLRATYIRLRPLPQSVKVKQTLTSHGALFLLCTLTLFGIAIVGSYAGTSILFAAYLAGAAISWLDQVDSDKPVSASTPGDEATAPASEKSANFKKNSHSDRERATSFKATSSVATRISEDSKTKEKGRRSSFNLTENQRDQLETTENSTSCDRPEKSHVAESTSMEKQTVLPEPRQANKSSRKTGLEIYEFYYMPVVNRILRPFFFASIGFSVPVTRLFQGPVIWRGLVYALLMLFGKLVCGIWLIRLTRRSGLVSEANRWKLFQYQAQSYYPAAILGSAMVSRGEIGFLISAVAESKDIFTTTPGHIDLYLIVTWTILLCTIIGPLATGLLAKRVKRLQKASKNKDQGRQDPLGIWGQL